jgi:hypothetical protein
MDSVDAGLRFRSWLSRETCLARNAVCWIEISGLGNMLQPDGRAMNRAALEEAFKSDQGV